MSSTYWLTAKQHATEATHQLSEKGLDVVNVTRRSRQQGVWLTVAHAPDEGDDVLAIVTRVDARAILET